MSRRGSRKIKGENGGHGEQNRIGQTNKISKLKPAGIAQVFENNIGVKGLITLGTNVPFVWLHRNYSGDELNYQLSINQVELIFR